MTGKVIWPNLMYRSSFPFMSTGVSFHLEFTNQSTSSKFMKGFKPLQMFLHKHEGILYVFKTNKIKLWIQKSVMSVQRVWGPAKLCEAVRYRLINQGVLLTLLMMMRMMMMVKMLMMMKVLTVIVMRCDKKGINNTIWTYLWVYIADTIWTLIMDYDPTCKY